MVLRVLFQKFELQTLQLGQALRYLGLQRRVLRRLGLEHDTL
jgi:hypothetical protein